MRSLSLFSGAMGLDLGLEAAGIETVGCVEFDRAAVDTIRLNRPNLPALHDDISSISAAHILKECGLKQRDIDIVAGGPPCQAFSVIGKRRGLEDGRGKLVFEFQRIVHEIMPKVFVMENVRGLHSMAITGGEKGSLYAELIKGFNEIGYAVDTFFVNAVNYGAPQIRERVILVGNRLGLKARFPRPTHSDKPISGQKRFVTLGDALSRRKDSDKTLMDFSPRKKKYLSYVPAGGNWRSMPLEIQKESMGKTWYLKGGRSAYWRRLSFDSPCPTIVTMPNHASTSMCHPDELRALTVGECAIIQQFPRGWRFSGSPMERYKQVGNAVPVILGKMAGKAALELLQGKAEKREVGDMHSIEHIRPHVRTRQYFKNGEVFAGSPYQNNQNRYENLAIELI
ncbi:Modification methylase HaeIII [Xanthomonas sacchari]|uniref:Cytosine-specific methyltransferase n=1 Tax=Xanthomonas sacchari TaxID=56458 RepID=A0AA46SU28_9XANT|nr:DNA cytosine methyltransferase [Xanthomonas sacchari]MCW0367078.1 Modification methylase HaeIII [Xanthomonas sacchari]MCW0441010.1 Modification methylase HaeIII [Xanthomonas sacchari]UYK88537.1 DNA cytosine methyltransferase [Xanthomonas sacchari]